MGLIGLQGPARCFSLPSSLRNVTYAGHSRAEEGVEGEHCPSPPPPSFPDRETGGQSLLCSPPKDPAADLGLAESRLAGEKRGGRGVVKEGFFGMQYA